jgi:hypothetical protein
MEKIIKKKLGGGALVSPAPADTYIAVYIVV